MSECFDNSWCRYRGPSRNLGFGLTMDKAMMAKAWRWKEHTDQQLFEEEFIPVNTAVVREKARLKPAGVVGCPQRLGEEDGGGERSLCGRLVVVRGKSTTKGRR